MNINLTPTQKVLLAFLKDGERKTKAEVKDVLPDDLSTHPKYVSTHISRLRTKLKKQGYDIVCEYRNRKIWYRLVRLISYD